MAEGNTPEETDNIKKKALTRLAVAGAITLVALAGLWWLDKSGKNASAPKLANPAPIISAPAPIIAPGPLDVPALPVAEDQAASVEAPPGQAPVEPPPPPRIGSHAIPARSAGGPVASTASPPATAGMPSQPAAKPILANAEPPAGRGFVVQLGVFTDPVNAQALVTRLKKQGIRAYTETRVHIGPYLNREEAEKAQAELRRMGISGVVGATK